MEVAELVDAAHGLGWRKEMTGWVSAARLQAFHAPLGAALVRAPPQIGMVIVGEVTCRRARTGDREVSRLRRLVGSQTQGSAYKFALMQDVPFSGGWVKRALFGACCHPCVVTKINCPMPYVA